MNPLRKKRLESSITRELALLIMRQKSKDDRIGFVSVEGVELGPELHTAKVRVSFFGSEESNSLSFQAIRARLGHFQSVIGRNLKLRFTPRLELIVSNAMVISESHPAGKAGE